MTILDTAPRTLPFVPVADRILVAGEWRQASGPAFAVTDPSNGETLQVIHQATADDADEAVRKGRAAADDPAWRSPLPHQRAKYLHRISDAIEANTSRLALLQSYNTGKTVAETTALVGSAAGTFRYFAGVLETADDDLTAPRGNFLTMSVHEPIGVIGAIAPWNSPVASDAQKIAPALAAGNAVVLKPAEWTPLVSLELARLIDETGLPKGLLSVLPGKGSVVGDAIVTHPDVGKVTFTGGTNTGRSIAHAAAEKLMPVSLELGGKSPTIVLDDADLDAAVNGVMYGIFSSTGQSCIAGSRLFVDRRIYDEFVEKLVAKTQRLRLGPGRDPDTQIGPMVHRRHRDSVAAYVDLAREEGGRVLCGGAIPDDERLRDGAYYPPTVIDGLPNSSRTCQEEIFGPVLVVLPFDGEADLVAQANDSVFGLASGIWTSDYRRAWKLARRLQAGTVWINTYKQFSISTPFGGVKESGLGVEKGRAGIAAYSRQKSIYWGLDEEPNPWAD
ncbi:MULTISPECIES: aldehyde dehydrogenase [unclassified Rhodococcus (in: high G+C Gram-positive bacteria)]|uniref:aldehyde dehydrogenase n=1 Tax=unclassified Rhodococcus (in: high G+C Gram-positive bacteria) TaxID=192944 RepID=UPI00163B2BF2|nr:MULTISPECIES: aldehyde dehydrogenase [unclassified Rhodococcus (in: high G+C Gram-positive bacteria)]MBC2641329.1 aldehyde dehydrogenase [Rhodococcus sp. 3A]MBC2893926.1 aldehyde dehydrogenase [Rhodococcus sp. 4CII]